MTAIDSCTCPECGGRTDVIGFCPYWMVCSTCGALGPAAGSPLASHLHWCEYLGKESQNGGRSIGLPMTKERWIQAREETGKPVPAEILQPNPSDQAR